MVRNVRVDRLLLACGIAVGMLAVACGVYSVWTSPTTGDAPAASLGERRFDSDESRIDEAFLIEVTGIDRDSSGGIYEVRGNIANVTASELGFAITVAFYDEHGVYLFEESYDSKTPWDVQREMMEMGISFYDAAEHRGIPGKSSGEFWAKTWRQDPDRRSRMFKVVSAQPLDVSAN